MEKFYEGREFADFDELDAAVTAYQQQQHVVFFKRSSKKVATENKKIKPGQPLYKDKFMYAFMQYGCKHYGKHRKDSKGVRINQRSFKTGCHANFTVSVNRKKDKMVMTKLNLEHNHDSSSELYNQYPEIRRVRPHEQQAVEQLLDRKVGAGKVKDYVFTVFGKKVTTKDIHNIRLKRKKGMREEDSTTMKAAQFDQPGGPSVLYTGQVPMPKLRHGEVMVQVIASAINRADTLQRNGRYGPPPGASTILGLEASGYVLKLGPDCQESKWAIGDKVMGLLSGGGNAEYVAVHEDHLMPVGNLSIDKAAAIPEAWLTAYQLLHFVGHIKSNDSVLIHAGGSGVGTAAIQLVKLAGGHPIVTAGSEVKLEVASSLGAEAGFNYKLVDFAEGVLKHTNGRGVDMILDCVGGSHLEKNLKAIAMDGQWILYGLLGGSSVDGPILANILRKRVTLAGTTLRSRSNEYKAELIKDFTLKALPFFENGRDFKLHPIIDKIFPLESIADAHQYMEDNRTVGKIVIHVSSNSGHTEL